MVASQLETLHLEDPVRLVGSAATSGARSAFPDLSAAKLVERVERATSDVLRLRVGSDSQEADIFLKIHRVGSGRRHERHRLANRMGEDFLQQQRAYAALGSSGPFGVARPIACIPEALASLTEGARGSTLDEHLRRARLRVTSLEACFGRVGQWLRTFQSALGSQGRVRLEWIRAYVELRVRRALEQGGGFGPEHRKQVLARFDELASQIDPADLDAVPIHGDFSLENILIDGDRVTAIDFDVGAGTAGTRYHDAAYLYLCMERLKAKPWLVGVEKLQRAFLRGFDPSLEPASPLFQMMLLQHILCRLAERHAGPRGQVREAFDRYAWRPCLHWAGL